MSRKRTPPWSQKLARVIRDRDGIELRTRGDVRAYIVALPEHHQARNAWQHAAHLLLEGASAETVTDQVELALFLAGRLDL